MEKRKKKIDELLHFFLEKVSNDKIDRFFARQIACHFNFEVGEVRELFELFRSSPCLSSFNELTRFPTSQFAISFNRLQMHLPTQEFLIFYCRGLLSNDCIKLFNTSANNTLVIPFTYFDNVELLYAYRALYRSALEHCVAVLQTCLQLKVQKTFRIDYTRSQTDVLDFSAVKLPAFSETIESKTVLSFHDVIIADPSLDIATLSPALTGVTICSSASQAINYLNFNLFDYLGYISVHKSSIYVPGHVLTMASLDRQGVERQEELLIHFELIRNNFLKPSIFDIRNSLMSKHVPQLNNRFIKCLVKRYVQTPDRLEESRSMSMGLLSVEQNLKDNFIGIEEKQSDCEDEKIYDDPEILSHYERNLMAIQKAIKEFQKEFVRNLDLDYPISDFENIITDALAGNKLSKVVLISRFYCFAITDFHINNFYDQDTYHFRELVIIILKSIKNINEANLVALLKATGNLDNAPLIADINAKMPFRKNYSPDACTFIKVLMTQFLIHRALADCNHPLANIYWHYIEAKYMKSIFKDQAEFFKLIETGRLLFKKTFIMVKAVQKFTHDEYTTSIYCEMVDAYPMFKQFCDFAAKIQLD